MRRSAYSPLLMILLALIVMPGRATADDLGASWPGPITRAAVPFDHDGHNEIADLEESCTLCHHSFDEEGTLQIDESSEELSCAECHEKDARQKTVPTTRAAFHNRCQGCHLQEAKGPIACGECHQNHSNPEEAP